MKSFYKIIIFIIVFQLVGCATLFKGTNSHLGMHSNPTGAEVYINGKYVGKTPLSLKLSSKTSYAIEFKMEGYKSITRNVTNKVGAGWVILDVLGGLVPIIIDAVTGAWYDLSEKNVDVNLDKIFPRP